MITYAVFYRALNDDGSPQQMWHVWDTGLTRQEAESLIGDVQRTMPWVRREEKVMRQDEKGYFHNVNV